MPKRNPKEVRVNSSFLSHDNKELGEGWSDQFQMLKVDQVE